VLTTDVWVVITYAAVEWQNAVRVWTQPELDERTSVFRSRVNRLLGLLVVAVAFMFAILSPPVILRLDLGSSVGQLSPAERASSLGEIRTTVFQGIGAIIVLLGAYIGWRQLQQTVSSAQAQIEMQRQTSVTDRYGRAVEQLAHEDQAIRLGAIYSLGRIAQESEAERGGVINILSSYIRARSPWAQTSNVGEPPMPEDRAAALPLRSRAQDIQAALTVLTRWIDDTQHPPEWLTVDLAHTDLRNGNLRGRCLWRVRLRGANLAGANLSGSDLRGADLREATLADADLISAQADETTWWPNGFDPTAEGVVIVDTSAE